MIFNSRDYARRTAFSHHMIKGYIPDHIEQMLGETLISGVWHKFNPNHDEQGRFASGPGNGAQLVQDIPEEDSRRGGGLLSDTYAETLQARMDLASGRISRVAPGNPVLDGMRAPGEPPDPAVVAMQEETAKYLERVDAFIKPEGRRLGRMGNRSTIRKVSGGKFELDALAKQLTSGYPGRSVGEGTLLYRVPGGYITTRRPSPKSPGVTATVDVKIPGMFIGKIKSK